MFKSLDHQVVSHEGNNTGRVPKYFGVAAPPAVATAATSVSSIDSLDSSVAGVSNS